MKMTKNLRFRCSEEFVERVKKLCEIKGIDFSNLAKQLIEKELKKNKI